MATESDKELADRLDAEDRLKARGLEKKRCTHCNGLAPLKGCIPCGNKGYTWEPRYPTCRST